MTVQGMTAQIAEKPSRKIRLSMGVTRKHGALSYLEMGKATGPAVVFLHGFGADLLTWQLCLVPLAADYRLVALDLPGHGRSNTDIEPTLAAMVVWLEDAFDSLTIDAAHIVGHSMGAKIALAFALAHPKRVCSLGLISPAGLGGEFHHDRLEAFLHDVGRAEDLAHHLLGPRGANLHELVTKSLSDAVGNRTRHASMVKMLDQARLHSDALAPEGFDWSKIRVPVVVVWGDRDRLIPLPSAHRLPRHAPLHIIAGAGHLPHMEAPGDVVRVLKEFLA